jgi:hypothetical protein
METIELDSWSDFENVIDENLLRQFENLDIALPFYFRGQADATWCLETTLERYVGPNRRVDRYYNVISRILSQIETFTDRNWDLPSSQDYVNNLRTYPFFRDDAVISYMQYLRHFGYPSPLLDWTRSPYVAAYFAFRDIASKAKSVAIFQLFVRFDSGDPSDGTYVSVTATPPRKNKRHYLQQSVYSVCVKEIDDHLCYVSHENPSVVGDDTSGTTFIKKYVLPASERTAALHRLEAYNINSYSLFGTEESLLETLFLRNYNYRQIYVNIAGEENAWW